MKNVVARANFVVIIVQEEGKLLVVNVAGKDKLRVVFAMETIQTEGMERLIVKPAKQQAN